MSTITCGSCQMEYDGTGLAAGVQFQCTQCGQMVQVGAPARAGVKRNTGRPRAPMGGAPKRGPARGGGRPAPQGQQQGEEQAGYAPAPKKGNNGAMMVGIGVGVVTAIVIVIVIVMSSGPAPADEAKEADKAKTEARKKEVAEEDARRLKLKQEYDKTYGAILEKGPAIEAALRGSDANTIENLFDWQSYALYNDTLIDANPDAYLKSKDAPLLCVGEWDKNEAGEHTGVFTGREPHGPDGLKARVMFYIQEFYFGKEDIRFERARSEGHEGYKLTIGSKEMVGKPVYISFKGGGVEKEFWMAAPLGDSNVKIINLRDKQSFPNLQELETEKARGDDRRDPFNPDRDPRRNPDDPPDPADGGGDDGGEEPSDPDGDLPVAAKTNVKPTLPGLVNAVEELKKGGKLNSARLKSIKEEPSKVEKKNTMGAFIDLLIDAVKDNDRSAKNRISTALWEVWQGFRYAEWEKDDMVYSIDFDGQSDSDLVIRRWLEVYNTYKTD